MIPNLQPGTWRSCHVSLDMGLLLEVLPVAAAAEVCCLGMPCFGLLASRVAAAVPLCCSPAGGPVPVDFGRLDGACLRSLWLAGRLARPAAGLGDHRPAQDGGGCHAAGAVPRSRWDPCWRHVATSQ